MKASAIIRETEVLAPPKLALPDDPTGLQCGDPDGEVDTLMLALDGSEKTVRQAIRAGAQMLLTHHPLLFRPVTRIDTTTPQGRALEQALLARLLVYCAHTNLDASAAGINTALARAAGIVDGTPLVPTGASSRLKVVTFVPPESLPRVRRAVFAAGAGIIGAYTRCSWSGAGEGTFYAGAGAVPAVGRAGRLEKVAEVRLETIVDRDAVAGIRDAIRRSHPYEEPPVDIYEMVPEPSGSGLGLLGRLERAVRVADMAVLLKNRLGTAGIRLVGSGARKVSRVAVCAGSGASLLADLAPHGVQLYITGDLKYHDARLAQDLGITVLDVGHYPGERYGFRVFGRNLEARLRQKGAPPRVLYARENDPFEPVG